MLKWFLKRAVWGIVALAVWDLCKRYESKCRDAEANKRDAQNYEKLYNDMYRRMAMLEERQSKTCQSCYYYGQGTDTCDYMIMTGRQRPGARMDGCSVWEERRWWW